MKTAPTCPDNELFERLNRFLASSLSGASEIVLSKIAPITAGNARQVWQFDLEWTDGAGRRQMSCVLMRKAEAGQLETHLETEFRVVDALRGSGVPVARALWIDSDGRWFGRPSFIMEKVAGASDLPPLLKGEPGQDSRRLALNLAAVAARLHTLDYEKMGVDFLPPATIESAAGQQVQYWEALFLKHRMEPHPVMVAAFMWLKEHLPTACRVSIVHGDFRFGNLLYEGDRINALLDWEMVHLGDPAEDIAWAYRALWSPRTFLSLEEFVGRYTELSGIQLDPETLRFYRLLGEVKHSIISLTGARSFADGRTRNLFLADRASTISAYLMQFLDWLPGPEQRSEASCQRLQS